MDDYPGDIGNLSRGWTLSLFQSDPMEPLLRVERLGNDIRVHLLGAPENSYIVEGSPDLANWQVLGTVLTDASGEGSFTQAGAVGSGLLFYRARLGP